MRHIKPYQIFEASAAALQELTQEQIGWLDKCAAGRWKLNPLQDLLMWMVISIARPKV